MSKRFSLTYRLLFGCFAFILSSCAVEAAPRSDARVLHVDFENYVDGVVQALNAGVRWLGDPFSGRNEGVVVVTKDFGLNGNRCGYVNSKQVDQIARIRLQRRFDAPTVLGDEVIEFAFRVTREEPTELEDLLLCSVRSKSGRTGVEILANGTARESTYQLDVRSADKPGSKELLRKDAVVSGLHQDEWIRIVQHRKRSAGIVELWAGPLNEEVMVGTFFDADPAEDSFTLELGDGSTSTSRGAGYWDDVRIGGLLQEGQSVAAAEPPLRDVSQEVADQKLPILVGKQRQLFVDDAVIESSTGLERTLHQVKKHPASPLIVPDKPWEGKSVLLYGGVVRDPESGRFRMWYLAWGKHVDQPTYICYAESADGISWTKPDLQLVEHEGSKQNNILMPGWSQTSVLYDPEDPDPNRRYKAVLRLNGTRGFLSADGIHWRDQGVILEQAYDGTTVHWDPVEKKWVAMVKIFRDGKRARGYAESKDFLHWTDTYYMMTVDERDLSGDQMYAMYMFNYETAYFGLLRMYHTDSDVVDIQLATSRNGKHWDRSIREPFIPTSSEKDSWDFANNAVPSTPPICVGDELWFYYSGRSTLHNEVPNDGSIGLATLRVDGFFSMDATENEGVLTTKPLQLTGDTLCINGDASRGSIRVEVLDEGGSVIQPFSPAHCQPLDADSVRHVVDWGESGNLSKLKGRTVRLRFLMQNAELYSFWSE